METKYYILSKNSFEEVSPETQLGVIGLEYIKDNVLYRSIFIGHNTWDALGANVVTNFRRDIFVENRGWIFDKNWSDNINGYVLVNNDGTKKNLTAQTDIYDITTIPDLETKFPVTTKTLKNGVMLKSEFFNRLVCHNQNKLVFGLNDFYLDAIKTFENLY